jgi:hypothetical protein
MASTSNALAGLSCSILLSSSNRTNRLLIILGKNSWKLLASVTTCQTFSGGASTTPVASPRLAADPGTSAE